MGGRIDPRKLNSQSKICFDALLGSFEAASGAGTPADKFLAGLLRRDRRIGSRDRNLVLMSVFASFRWWGWIKALGMPGHEPESCARVLLAACAAEGGEIPQAAESWAETAGVPFAKYAAACKEESPAKRASSALALLGVKPGKLKDEALIPDWSLPELDPSASKPCLYEFLQRRPPVWLRAQTDDVDSLVEALRKAGLSPERHPFVKKAVKLQGGSKVNLHSLPEFNKGLFEIQDISSQCIGLACLPEPGQTWWDACAGGGGKSLQLADLLRRKGSVRATDTREYKLQDLKKRAARAAFPNIRTGPWDGSPLDVKKRVFDGVLVDAPCSSSGRWRRNPDARWIADKSWVDELSETQMKILRAVSTGVKPGGVLVYATCSMFRREDFANVELFLKELPEFSLEPFPNPLTGEMTDGTLLTLPWDADCDASFVARFRRSA